MNRGRDELKESRFAQFDQRDNSIRFEPDAELGEIVKRTLDGAGVEVDEHDRSYFPRSGRPGTSQKCLQMVLMPHTRYSPL